MESQKGTSYRLNVTSVLLLILFPPSDKISYRQFFL